MDGISYITTDKTVGFGWSFIYIMADKQYDLDGILHITTDKIVGFGWDFKYNNR